MAQTRPPPTLSRGFTRLGRFLAPYAIACGLREVVIRLVPIKVFVKVHARLNRRAGTNVTRAA